MEHEILKSVINITNQRDVDSLEYSLVATLAELTDAKDIGIYKLVDNGMEFILEETVRLSLSRDAAENVAWTEGAKQVSRDENIQRCIDMNEAIRFKHQEILFRIILPIKGDNKVVAALNIASKIDLTPALTALESIVRIYENYLFVLNESERDKLTGLFNRRTFDKKIDRLLQIQRNKQLRLIESESDREKRSLKPHSEAWLAIIDVDHFKRVNDQYGHVFGDGVLLLLAHKMRQCFRQSDYLFRFGGEEFVVILEPHPNEQAYITLDRFREAIAAHRFPLVGKVTVSIGYARITEQDYPPAILHSADKALYYAKEHGRNQVSNYELLVEEQQIKETHLGAAIDITANVR